MSESLPPTTTRSSSSSSNTRTMSSGWHNGGGLNRPSTHASTYSSNYNDSLPINTWATTDSAETEAGSLRDKYEKMKGYFGEVKRDRRDLLSEHYEKENSDYPEAFSRLWGGQQDGVFDRNGHMERVMIEKTMATKNWYLSRMAPWKQHESSLTFEWSKTLFTEPMLDRLPEESMPRLLSSRRTGGRTSMLRYGIALLLEATFAETPLGRQTYIMNVEQMRVACVQTASYGVMISIMEHTPYVDVWRRGNAWDSRQERDFDALDKELNDEVDNWGVMHKHTNGMRIVLDRMRATLTNRNKRANFTMFPQNTGRFQRSVDLDNKFFVTGHATSQDVDRSQTEEVTCESHAFSMGENEEGHDPIFRHRTIGAFATLDDIAVRDDDVAEYRTRHMDTVMYDQSLDEFFMAKYALGYKLTGVWNYQAHGAPLTTEIGRGTMHDYSCYTYGQLYRKCTNGVSRAIDKIYALPESKRQAFFDSLLLLKADSPLATIGGEPFPGGANPFNAHAFNRMDDGDEAFDESPLVSVQEHRANAANEGAFSRDALLQRSAYRSKLDRNSKRNWESADRAFTDQELYDDNADMEIDGAPMPDRYERLDDDHVALIPGSDVQVRKIRRKFHATGNASTAVHDRVNLASIGASITALFPKSNDRAIQKTIDDCHSATAKLYVDAILASTALDAQRASLLTELARIIKGCLYTSQYGTRDAAIAAAQKQYQTGVAAAGANVPALKAALELAIRAALAKPADPLVSATFSTEVIGAFTPVAARCDLRSAIDSIATNFAPLEIACKDASVNIHGGFDPAVLAPYRWKPTAGSTEDGQVGLRAFNEASTLSLPNDSFAATLAADHLVIFNIDNADATALRGAFSPVIELNSCKKARVDALVWSIAMSLLTTCKSEVEAVDLFKKADSKILARLVRWAQNKARTQHVLMSQLPMKGGILVLDKALSDGLVYSIDAKHVANPYKSIEDAFTNRAFEFHVSAPGMTGPLSEAAYVSPVELDVAALARPHVVAPAAAIPGSAETHNAWSKAYIGACIDRAAVTSGRFYAFCVENDIPLPFALRAWRPNKTYNMASALSMQAGLGNDAAARTYYQNPHMMMAANAAQKMIYGHLTLYFKTIVFNPDAIVIARDIYCSDYIGGNSRRSWNPLSVAHTAAYASGELGVASIFWTFAPMNNAECHWWQSITGEMPESLPCTQDVRDAMRWEGCDAFASFWSYKTNGRTNYSPDAPYSSVNNPNDRKHNVLCLQDFQQKFDPTTGRYSRTILNKGHWGENACYPGAAKVMRGTATHFDIPDYMPIRKTAVI